MTANPRPLRDLIGLSAAMSTPFHEDGAVDWDRFAAHAKNLLGQGMNVVTAFGTTGEGVSIPTATRVGLYDAMDARGVTPDRLVECVYEIAAEDSGRSIRRAMDAGAAGVLLVPPFYFTPDDEGLFRWFAETIEAAGPDARDIVLYNIPQLTGAPLGAALVARLRAAFPEPVIGVKDSGGDWAHTEALVNAHKDLMILVGHEGHLARAVGIGASGAISGVANFAPDLVRGLAEGRADARTDPLLDAILANPVVPAIKAIIAARTGDAAWTRVRAPLAPLDPPVATRLAAAVASILDGAA